MESKFEPLLLTSQTRGLTQVGKITTMYTKMKGFHVMLGILQSRDQFTNQSMFHKTGKGTIRERRLKFPGHLTSMLTDEPDNQFVIYESRFRSSLRPEAPMTTYLIHL